MQPRYQRRIIRAGTTVEIEETYPTRFGDELTRKRASKPTPQAMKHYNEEIAIRKLARLINANFVPDDWSMTLHYENYNRPKEYQTACDKLSGFMRKLRKLYSKCGVEFKYIKRTAFGERGAVHHHVIIPQGVDTKEIIKLWKGHIKSTLKARPPDFTPLFSTGEYSSLAAYLVRQAGENAKLHEKKWVASRNLKKPKEEVEYINKIKWNEPPTPWPGYYIDVDEIRSGCNPVNGRPYLFYRMVKLPPEFVCYDENGKRITGKAAVKYYRQNNKDYIKKNWFDLNPEGEVIFKVKGKSEEVRGAVPSADVKPLRRGTPSVTCGDSSLDEGAYEKFKKGERQDE